MEGPLFQSIACVVSDFAFLFSRVKKYLAFRQLDKRNDALNAWGLLFLRIATKGAWSGLSFICPPKGHLFQCSFALIPGWFFVDNERVPEQNAASNCKWRPLNQTYLRSS